MEDEYPAEGYITQEFNRKIAETRTTITKTSEEIMLKVEGIDGKYTEVKTTLDGLTVTDASGTTKINGSSIKTDNLYVDAANIKGTLTADQIQTGSIRVGDLKDGSNYATKTYVDNNAGLNANEVNSAIATYIDRTSITAQSYEARRWNSWQTAIPKWAKFRLWRRTLTTVSASKPSMAVSSWNRRPMYT